MAHRGTRFLKPYPNAPFNRYANERGLNPHESSSVIPRNGLHFFCGGETIFEEARCSRWAN